jgi:hypothetical protein
VKTVGTGDDDAARSPTVHGRLPQGRPNVAAAAFRI